MKITFFGPTLNHHQAHLTDEMYKKWGKDFLYVFCLKQTGNLKGGINYNQRPYFVNAFKNKESLAYAEELAKNSDVAIFGAASIHFEIIRLKGEKPGLCFEISERWFKRRWLNIFSPKLLKWLWSYYRWNWEKKPLYKLCNGGFVKKDHYILHTFNNKCFKWGYFIPVPLIETENISNLNQIQNKDHVFSIMWCSRFIKWKHPELPILLAQNLKRERINFHIDMYGSGILEQPIKNLSSNLCLNDCISFHGSVDNKTIINSMNQHDIFIFTSDRREGWGVVANEAMINRCLLVASDSIGCVPFLIDDYKNGLTFRSCHSSFLSLMRELFESIFLISKNKANMTYDSPPLKSLTEKIKWLIANPEKTASIKENAYETISTTWSPKTAVNRLSILIDNLKKGMDSPFDEGPCSPA